MTQGGLNDEELTRKDTSYSPASESETQAKQQDPVPETIEPEAAERVKVAPGTGGPDDPGDIEMDIDDIDLDELDVEAPDIERE
jgi:hypothetical protein